MKMKNFKNLGLAGVVLALLALGGPSSAFATTFSVGGVTQNTSLSISTSLFSGTSLLLKDSYETSTITCTSSDLRFKTTTATGTVSGPVGTLTYGSCSDTTTVLAKGSLSFSWTSGTNGTVSSSGTEVTVSSTFFGASAVCKTGTGSVIGTFTGVSSGNATIDMNAKLNCGILGTSTWTGTYTVTSPSGLGLEP
jgi:hypothetical protein